MNSSRVKYTNYFIANGVRVLLNLISSYHVFPYLQRWLRQAMYESNNTVVTGGSGNSSPIPNGGMSPNPHVSHPSPSASPPVDFVTPLKKRRMARESLSAENAPGLPPTPSTPSTDFISSEKVDIGNQPLLDIRVTAKTKNGFRQHLSPITPLTPGTENLFEVN